MKRALKQVQARNKEIKRRKDLSGAEHKEYLTLKMATAKNVINSSESSHKDVQDAEHDLERYQKEYKRLENDPESFAAGMEENKNEYRVLHDGINFILEREIYNEVMGDGFRYGFTFKGEYGFEFAKHVIGKNDYYGKLNLQNELDKPFMNMKIDPGLRFLKVTEEDYESVLSYFIKSDKAFISVSEILLGDIFQNVTNQALSRDPALTEEDRQHYKNRLDLHHKAQAMLEFVQEETRVTEFDSKHVKEFFETWFVGRLGDTPWPNADKTMTATNILNIYKKFCRAQGKDFCISTVSWGIKLAKSEFISSFLIENSNYNRKFYKFVNITNTFLI
mmetsp:Transcript_12574/g.16925  ORF Transcript_12574/g.16925 Transcript_12574/m.16925 type:complete len:334 (+) Transcript_12574:271-1272(+)